ncbi:MAG: hypothetical protein PHY47_08530 [Lachnospiraceae bacterium]|nr:hypothetical protein [Lachnospiraceae bacterium]
MTSIIKWSESGLKHPSVARISKTISLSKEKFRRKIGVLHLDDRYPIMEKYIQYIQQ